MKRLAWILSILGIFIGAFIALSTRNNFALKKALAEEKKARAEKERAKEFSARRRADAEQSLSKAGGHIARADALAEKAAKLEQQARDEAKKLSKSITDAERARRFNARWGLTDDG